MFDRRPAPLGEGVYSVADVCRVLAPTMTSRKVHYWLDTGLIHGIAISAGSRGRPTLLTYRQMLEIRTVQYLRDQLRVTLPNVREAFKFVLTNLFDTAPHEIRFTLVRRNVLAAELLNGEAVDIPGNNPVMPWPEMVGALNRHIDDVREAWETKRLMLRAAVVADARVVGGTPTIVGTRIETAFVARFADEGRTYTVDTINAVLRTYPHLTPGAVRDALDFEGVSAAA